MISIDGHEIIKWRPVSDADWDSFTESFCNCCALDETCQCKILDAAYSLQVKDLEYPAELQIGSNGWAICTAFEESQIE